jgi:D-glycero-alpha-D-manno-heptose 1-phosphate guanylyltransferase
VREAIILAGGLGTRLRSVTGADMPKPMAEVANRPFLYYVLKQLKRWNTERIVLSVGYKHESIREHFNDEFIGMELVYSVEHEPLGTGGAIRQSLEYLNGNDCFILNGDSFFDVDLDALEQLRISHQADLTMALKHVEKSDRYGTVKLNEQNRVTQFNEKQYVESGFINAGIYSTTKSLLHKLPSSQKFSFEHDYLKAFANRDAIYGLTGEGYFIDIGVPEDYAKANQDFLHSV